MNTALHFPPSSDSIHFIHLKFGQVCLSVPPGSTRSQFTHFLWILLWTCSHRLWPCPAQVSIPLPAPLFPLSHFHKLKSGLVDAAGLFKTKCIYWINPGFMWCQNNLKKLDPGWVILVKMPPQVRTTAAELSSVDVSYTEMLWIYVPRITFILSFYLSYGIKL